VSEPTKKRRTKDADLPSATEPQSGKAPMNERGEKKYMTVEQVATLLM